ncbi:MAG: magnesium chelatase [Dehalococcoidia bacterium]|nr:MAG: magnesium chelatase [Dehalococcoidia bacterium]
MAVKEAVKEKETSRQDTAGKQKLERVVFPFSAMVGQEKMKLALLLNAVNPAIGGVLVRGEKGTGKSTISRALADLLPEIKVVEGCPFHCNPEDPSEMCPNCQARYFAGGKKPLKSILRKTKVVDLPLGATEDRVLGTLDLESAIKKGERSLDPGILAEANRGITYIDEINLLDDHVIDVLLDASSSKVNVVEREGISFSHPSSFILVGSMNPEEGELRPQLLDRIALHVVIEGVANVDQRVKIITERNEFEKDQMAFTKKYQGHNTALRNRVLKAKALLPKVKLPDNLLLLISRLCDETKVEGARPDIMLSKTAKTLAAFDGRTVVTTNDIKKAAEFILPFRMKATPFEEDKWADPKFIENMINEFKDDPFKESTKRTGQQLV